MFDAREGKLKRDKVGRPRKTAAGKTYYDPPGGWFFYPKKFLGKGEP